MQQHIASAPVALHAGAQQVGGGAALQGGQKVAPRGTQLVDGMGRGLHRNVCSLRVTLCCLSSALTARARSSCMVVRTRPVCTGSAVMCCRRPAMLRCSSGPAVADKTRVS